MAWRVPEYRIERLNKKPFEAKYVEFFGWHPAMKVGEVSRTVGFDLYGSDTTPGEEYYEEQTTVKGYAVIHGVVGTEIEVKTWFTAGGCFLSTYVVEHTKEGYRVLASGFADSEIEHERYRTFLDEGESLEEWVADPNTWTAFAEEAWGDVRIDERELILPQMASGKVLEGCFQVTVGGKEYETVRTISVDYSNEKKPTVTEHYLDVNGRTVLMRCFESGEWCAKKVFDKYGARTPKEEYWLVNGEAFLHSHDIFKDYVM